MENLTASQQATHDELLKATEACGGTYRVIGWMGDTLLVEVSEPGGNSEQAGLRPDGMIAHDGYLSVGEGAR